MRMLEWFLIQCPFYVVEANMIMIAAHSPYYVEYMASAAGSAPQLRRSQRFPWQFPLLPSFRMLLLCRGTLPQEYLWAAEVWCACRCACHVLMLCAAIILVFASTTQGGHGSKNHSTIMCQPVSWSWTPSKTSSSTYKYMSSICRFNEL